MSIQLSPASAYSAYERLRAPARPSSALWRLILGLAVLAALFLALSAGWAFLHGYILGTTGAGLSLAELQRAGTPRAVLVNLYLFSLLTLALAVTLGVVHRRRLRSLIGPRGPAVAQFFKALFAVALLFAIMAFLPQPGGLTPQPNTTPALWLRYLPAALLGLLIQVSAEEMVFRGYLQSQLAARFSSPLIWLCGPALIFGLLHHDPSSFGPNTWVVIGWAALFGLIAGDLTARAGTLGPSIALHLINNFAAILLTAPKGSFDGLALFVYPFAADDAAMMWRWMPMDLLMLLCSWLAIRLALRR